MKTWPALVQNKLHEFDIPGNKEAGEEKEVGEEGRGQSVACRHVRHKGGNEGHESVGHSQSEEEDKDEEEEGACVLR